MRGVASRIARGYYDARGERRSDEEHVTRLPHFRKELGEPVFADVIVGERE